MKYFSYNYNCGPMPNVMAALPIVGCALCSTSQSLADAHYWSALPRCETCWNLQRCPKLTKRSQLLVSRSSPYSTDMWRRYCCLTSFSDCQYVP